MPRLSGRQATAQAWIGHEGTQGDLVVNVMLLPRLFWRAATPATVAVPGTGGIALGRPVRAIVVGFREPLPSRLERLDQIGRERQPARLRLQRLLRQVDRPETQHLVGPAAEYLVAGGLAHHPHVAPENFSLRVMGPGALRQHGVFSA